MEGIFISFPFLRKLRRGRYKKIWARSMIVVEEMVGKVLRVYNGKRFVSLRIKESMVGFKLGAFSYTRIKGKRKKRKKRK